MPCAQTRNTSMISISEVPERPSMCYIFEKRLVQGYQKLHSRVSNSQIQIHKYTNTAYYKLPERPSMCYIFENRIVQGYQKLHSRVSNSQIQKYKYTNTQIQHMTNCQKDPACAIFLKIGLFKDIKNDILVCQTHKYKNTNTKNTNTKYTNTQIQHMTKCQKDPACGIFLKRGLFKDFKNYIPMCRTHKYKNTNTKYTNTAYDEVPERLNMFYEQTCSRFTRLFVCLFVWSSPCP